MNYTLKDLKSYSATAENLMQYQARVEKKTMGGRDVPV